MRELNLPKNNQVFVKDVERTKSFTAYPNSKAEFKIKEIIQKVNLYCREVNDDSILSVLLIGGYGKGEGGVSGNSQDVKNNIDLLIIDKDQPSTLRMRTRLEMKFKEIQEEFNVKVDYSFMNLNEFVQNSSTLLVYDLKVGHYKVYQHPDFNIETYLMNVCLNKIDESEFEALLVNRSILLLINDYLVNKKVKNTKKVKVHIAKAIIGLGDAVLYKNKQYSWSYEEKARRLRKFANKYPRLTGLYDQASNFRLHDDNYLYDGRDIKLLNQEVKDLYQEVLESENLVNMNKIYKSNQIKFKNPLYYALRYSQVRKFIKDEYKIDCLWKSPDEVVNFLVLDNLNAKKEEKQKKVIQLWALLRDSNLDLNYLEAA